MDIPERKLNYLFNHNIEFNAHNTPRAIQNAQQMQRLGFYNTLLDRKLVREHLLEVVKSSNNILTRFTKVFINQAGTLEESEVEVRESLLCGRSGKFAKVKSSWEVISAETCRFISAELYGG